MSEKKTDQAKTSRINRMIDLPTMSASALAQVALKQ